MGQKSNPQNWLRAMGSASPRSPDRSLATPDAFRNGCLSAHMLAKRPFGRRTCQVGVERPLFMLWLWRSKHTHPQNATRCHPSFNPRAVR